MHSAGKNYDNWHPETYTDECDSCECCRVGSFVEEHNVFICYDCQDYMEQIKEVDEILGEK